jgi:hypothetical protein
VFDAGPDAPVDPVVVVVNDLARRIAPRGGDRGDAAIAAVAKDLVAGEQVREDVASDDDVVGVIWPATRG